jgi:hypothetical protein
LKKFVEKCIPMALGASLLIVVPAFLAWGRAAALIMGGG